MRGLPSQPHPCFQSNRTAVRTWILQWCSLIEFPSPPCGTYTPKGAKLSPAQLESDQRVVAATLQKIHESLAKAEFDQSRLMEEKTLPAGGTSKTIELRPIPKEIAEAAYAELSRGLQSLSKNSPQVERLKDKALSEIASFTDRPKPFKVLMVRTLADNSGDIIITERFVDDLKLPAPDAQGRTFFSVGTGPGQEVVRDGYYGKEDEWTKRYSHFFEKAP
jgi:hypothetical protein